MNKQKEKNPRSGLEVAVIGMAGRFPGSQNIHEFWENLKNAVESIVFFSDEEIKKTGVHSEIIKSSNYVKAFGVLENAEYFDASFFGYTHSEAEIMNPEMRFFHECAWEALEDAGYNPEFYDGLIGVYAGASSSFYWEGITLLSGKGKEIGSFAANHLTSTDFIPSKISYKLNLKGPSYFIKTACSTSLVAIHIACRSILTGECHIALAGGVKLNLDQIQGYIYEEGMINSSDGHCRAFSASADGTIGGNGIGIVVLKRLKNAIADRDHIYAVVKGSAVNNDGNRKVGYTAPSVPGQVEVIRTAIALAEIETDSIGYIETHGTGTPLGDPIEIEALTLAFNTGKKNYCPIGAVKTNVGHLDSAAGVAGFIKTVLIIKNKLIPPSLNFDNPNPKMDFINSPFYVNTHLIEWESNGYPRRACVSSLGIGGTNTHVVLEEAPELPAFSESRKIQLLFLSAKTSSALDRTTLNLVEYLKKNPCINLSDVAYTLHLGRKAFKYRRMAVCSNVEQAIHSLSYPGVEGVNTSSIKEEDNPIVFMFSAPGSQYVNMGWDLYREEPVYRDEVDRCMEILESLLGFNVKEILYPGKIDSESILEEGENSWINNALYDGPIKFTIECALAKMLMKWGIKPYAMIGHSFGEYLAAHLSGIFSMEDALKLVVLRGKLMGQISDAVMMRPILSEFESFVKKIKLNKLQIPYISCLTGTWVSESEVTDPLYWAKHLVETVRFSDGVKTLLEKKNSIFIQVGSDRDLPLFVKQHQMGEGYMPIINLVRHKNENVSDIHYLLNSLGLLWLNGQKIDWLKFYAEEKRCRISLPPYPFEGKPYWIEGNLFGMGKEWVEKTIVSPENKSDSAEWFYIPSWKSSLLPIFHFDRLSHDESWMIFYDKCFLGDQLIKKLNQYKQKLIIIKRGEAFSRINSNEYIINPGNSDDYSSLFNERNTSKNNPLKIIYLWGISNNKEGLTSEHIDTAILLGFKCLIYLAQAIGKIENSHENKFQLFILTSKMQKLIGDSSNHPENSLVMGPVKVIPLEYPNIITRAIDVDALEPGRWDERDNIINRLLGEFTTHSKDLVIAYRDNERLVQDFEPVRLDKSEKLPSLLKEKGVYWIAGGLSGIGIELAEFLARTVHAKLILTGRSEFPPKDRWEEWLAIHEINDAISRKILKLKEFEKWGAEALVISGDVSNIKSMKAIVDQAQLQFGKINGVIHSAGVPEGSIIQRKTEKMIKHVLDAKVRGTLALHTVLENVELDFFVLCSSGNSILPNWGQVGYCSANAFLDAFSHYRSGIHRKFTIAINWPRWQNTGMSVAVELKHKELTGEELRGGITSSQGVDAFVRILENSHPQMVFSTIDLQRMVRSFGAKTGTRELEVKEFDTPVKMLYPRPDLSSLYVAPTNEVERSLSEIWENFFGIANLGINDDFFELGGDSLSAITIIAKIHKKMNARIPVLDFFAKCITIKNLAKYLKGKSKESYMSIEPAEEKEYYELSSAQKRLYVLQQMVIDSVSYNIPHVIPFEEGVEKEKLESVFKRLIERHDSLRTSFIIVNEKPVQRIHRQVDFSIRYSEIEDEADFISLFSEFTKPFNLSAAPLLKVKLISVGASRRVLLIDMHHIITDGTSLDILTNEFYALYSGEALQHLRLQYKDYSEWYNRVLDLEMMKKQECYWMNEFSDEIPTLNLPTDFSRPVIQSFEGDSVRFRFNAEETRGLKAVAKENDSTLFMCLIAVFNALMSKLSVQEDIIIGTPVAARRHSDLQNVIGMFTNTLLLRNYPFDEQMFKELLSDVKERTLLAFENQEYPFEELVDKLSVPRDISRNPLFDIMFVLQNINTGLSAQDKKTETETSQVVQPDSYREYENIFQTAKFDLTIIAIEKDRGLFFSFQYCTKLFKKETIERFIIYFKKMISIIVKDTGVRLGEIEIIPEEEKVRILLDFNDTQMEYPKDKTICQIFEEQVEKNSGNIAVIGSSVLEEYEPSLHITYYELNEKSNRLAFILREKGVQPDTCVGIMGERSIEMMIGIFGILKSGGAYLPIDPNYPKDRIDYIIKDSNTKIIIDKSFWTHFFTKNWSAGGIPLSLTTNICYIIYTSGSTGKPKGTIIEHRSVINRLNWMQNAYPVGSGDVILQKTPVVFDVSVWELFWWSFQGAGLCLLGAGLEKDPDSIAVAVGKYRVTTMHFVPSMLNVFLAHFESVKEVEKELNKLRSLKQVFSSGEALTVGQAHRFFQLFKLIGAPPKLVNLYGPTEATVDVSYFECPYGVKLEKIPIGKPINNIRLYILDKGLSLQPIGISGELYIAGVGLARGYLNRPELTAERFISFTIGQACLFPSQTLNTNTLYKTGDLARWDLDGNIEYLGRIDLQVKIRGFRIELEEIESLLTSSGDFPVKEAVVVARPDISGDIRIIAYIEPNKKNAFTVFRLLELRGKKFSGSETLYQWPNRMPVYCLNRMETDFMYKEIFEERFYMRHGITLKEGSCVFDVGANIGVFSLFVNRSCKNARIYSFEPLPPIYHILSLNISLYKGNIKTFNYGIGADEGEVVFTYYPHASILSGRFANKKQEEMSVRAFLSKLEPSNTEDMYNELLEERLTTDTYTCGIKTLSQVIEESGVTVIDLLKIDVEKSEMEVLKGIKEEHWPLIRQLVIEVHESIDEENALLIWITQLLEGKGYCVETEQEELLEGARLFNLFAIREPIEEIVRQDEPEPAPFWLSVEDLVQGARDYLISKLPEHMVPTHIEPLIQWPLTTSGKIDRKALPDPGAITLSDYTAPRNDIEKKLVDLWSEILGRNESHTSQLKTSIGINDNFFEIGGHSLKATILVSNIHKIFDVKVPLGEIFKMPKIKELANYIKEKSKERYISIDPAEEKEYYLLSSAQKRLYILHKMSQDSIVYNMPEIFYLPAESDLKKIKETFNKLIKRHESLRTSFHIVNDTPVQVVHDVMGFDLEFFDFQDFAYPQDFINRFVRPFDLSIPPLFRAGIIKEENGKVILIVDMNHIISDGVSLEILIKDFKALYEEKLPPLRIQYKDFSEWQDEEKEKENLKRQEEYWLKEFEGEIPVLELPTDYSRPVEQNFEGDNILFKINSDEVAGLKHIALSEGASLFMVLLAIYNILLSKVGNREDIVVGTPVAGRRHSDLEKIIGMFVNTLSLRNYPVGEKTFSEYIKDVKYRTLDAFENQDYQFEELVDKLEIVRDIGRNPLFDVMFNYLIIDTEMEPVTNERKNEEGKNHDWENKTTKFNLALTAIEKDRELFFSFQYCTKLFKKESIERFSNCFRKIIVMIVRNPGIRLNEIHIISEEEKALILNDFNKTELLYPKNKTIHRLFNEQVERTPDNIAIIGPSVHMINKLLLCITYKELDEKSNRLAHVFRLKNIGLDTIVGIMVERSVEMVIGILGILKAGGIYLPLDPSYPQERIDYMLKDSRATLIVTNNDLKELTNLPIPRYPDFDYSQSTSLAYIIYTSGSTGKPKGVLIEHKNVAQLVKGTDFIDWGEDERLLLTGNIGFDITTFEIFGPLLNGATLFLMAQDEILNTEKLLKFLFENKISILHLIPQLFNQMAELLPEIFERLSFLLVGGDMVAPHFVNKIRNLYENLKILHMYGPTENTTFSTFFSVNKDYETSIPIGKPVSNSCLYIFDKYDNLSPIGIAGELIVGGDGVAIGYLNQPELTKEKFIDLKIFVKEQECLFPTNKPIQIANTIKLYKTGDFARWLPDGNVEFLGRVDNQIKIRGIRIELGEIENQLLAHDEIKEVVVLIKENMKGDRYLCAYIVSNKEIPIPGLREYLSPKLPQYMIPDYFVEIDKIPLSHNGKVERKSLPNPWALNFENNINIQFAAPGNEVEKKLVEIWEKVLGVNNIGIDQNFFKIGGDSIKTIQIISRMNSAGYKLEMKDIFQFPEISDLATRVRKTKRIPCQSIITGTIPLTPIQKAFFSQNSVDIHYNNQAIMLYSMEGFDIGMVEAVFSKLQTHHDALRISYKKEAGEIIQINRGVDYPLSLQVYDFRNREDGVNMMEFKVNEIQASIELEKGPMMKLGLFNLNDGDRLLIVVHHLVIDGVSWRILFEDIETLYGKYNRGEKLDLPLKTDSFKLWSEKLSMYSNSKMLLKEKTYWRKLESKEVPSIPKDFEVEDNEIKDTESVSFTLREEQTEKLLTRANEVFRTEINDILLTALGIGIKNTFKLERVSITLEGHGREEILEDIDISRTVGWFTSLYPVMIDVSYSDDLGRQIKEIKETLRRIPNKGIGYGILKYLTAEENKKDIEFKLKPQISFNYLGQFDADVKQLSTFKIAKESVGNSLSPEIKREYLLDVSGMTANNRLTITISFNKKHFKSETITVLIENFETELKRIITFCCSKEKVEFTPSDFTYKELPIETVDWLIREYPGMEDIYTLTPMQEGMLFHALIDDTSFSYFEQVSYRLQGDLNIRLVEKSLNELLKRHDILRTAFVYKNVERPAQVVLREKRIDFYYGDISKIVEQEEKENYIKEFKEKDKGCLFDLSKGALMRVAILQVAESEYEFTWSSHHILMDGWCLGILNSEFFEIYSSFIESRPYKLPVAKPYRTFIKWLEKQGKEASARYWGNYLDSFEERTGVPKTKVSKEGNTYKNESFFVELDTEKTAGLNKLAAANRVTFNIATQALWGILIGKYNRKEDVVFGAVVSGRPSDLEGVESMVGLFINTIPVRIRFEGKMKFSQLLQVVQAEALASEPYHSYPLAEIQSGSELKQNLIDHIFIFENYPIAEQIEGYGKEKSESNKLSFKLANVDVFVQTNYNFNIVLGVSDRLRMTFRFNGNEYDRDFVEKISKHFLFAIDQVIESPEIEVRALTLLSDGEKTRIAHEFNNTKADYPKNKTIHRLFEEQVVRTPDDIAVIGPSLPVGAEHLPSFENVVDSSLFTQLSYKDLNEKSNRLAHNLQAKGVKSETIVGIIVERYVEIIVGIVGVLKAGGTYLPIDPEYPKVRIDYMLKDSGATLLITKNDLEELPGLPTSQLPNFPLFSTTGNRQPAASLAYVIYTSGTTGKPKGVAIKHENLVNYVNWFTKKMRLTGQDKTILTTSLAFDLGYTALFPPILNGCELHILPRETYLLAEWLLSYIKQKEITYIKATPSLFSVIVNSPGFSETGCKSLRLAALGGEPINLKDIETAHSICKHLQIMNHYGPTEATIGSVATIIDFDTFDEYKTHPVIGKPVDNASIYILGKDLNLMPVGIPGELCIAGAGVGRGYLNRPELTAEKFIYMEQACLSPAHPRTLTTEILYKTGDLARFLSDGNIEFLGRIDHQIKIRGFRIELGDIENCLSNISGIKETVVVALAENGGEKYICAYFVSDSEYGISELREYLLKELPDYMIPSYFVQIEKIPLTSNGKINRKALPIPELKTGESYLAPGNEIEKKLVGLWAEILGRDESHTSQLKTSIGIDDSFFELGGHSLKATILVSKMHKVFDVKVPLVELFKIPTIRGLSRLITKLAKDKYAAIEPTEEKEYYPLSSVQKRMYVVQQMQVESKSYNIPTVVALDGEINYERLKDTFRQLIKRHESLRTSFVMLNEETAQVIHEDVEFKIEYLESEEDNSQEIIENFLVSFDLSKAPLLRVGLIKFSESKYVLMAVMHHIISDGVSRRILVNEFLELYCGENLIPLKIQYKDFAEWQNRLFAVGLFKNQEEYWLNKFKDNVPILNLPTDYPRTSDNISDMGGSITFDLEDDLTMRLYEMVKNTQVTVFMFLLAVYNVLLSKFTGQTDIIVVSPIAGRRHNDLGSIIGMFVNMLAIRNRPEGENSFRQFLDEVKINLLEAYENQEYQFEELVVKLNLQGHMNKNPLLNTVFTMQNITTENINSTPSTPRSNLKVAPYKYNREISVFDLHLIASEGDGKINLRIEYSTQLFFESTIRGISKHYLEIIEIALHNPDIKIKDINVTSNIVALKQKEINDDHDFGF